MCDVTVVLGLIVVWLCGVLVASVQQCNRYAKTHAKL